MPQGINWELKSNNKSILKQNNGVWNTQESIIVFTDAEGSHKIDLLKKTYERKAKDYIMIITFWNKMGTFKFNTGEVVNFAINAELIATENEINIKYNFDDDIKTLIIKKEDEKCKIN